MEADPDDGATPLMGADDSQQGKTREERETETVTDFVHEGEVDLGKAQAALDSVTTTTAVLAKVLFTGTLVQEDIAMVMDECDLTKEQATLLLQENEGKTILALKKLVQGAQ